MGAKQRKSDRSGLVYSTDPNWNPEPPEEEMDTPPPGEQRLRLRVETQGRAGKVVTVVEGFVGRPQDLDQLGRRIKAYCGSGGSVKEGRILMQGRLAEKIRTGLQQWGYKIAKG